MNYSLTLKDALILSSRGTPFMRSDVVAIASPSEELALLAKL